MAASNDVIYSRAGSQTRDNTTGMNQPVTAASGDYNGTGANNSLVFTAGVEGGYVQRIRLKAVGTNVASVARFYINNGSSNLVATNNTFFHEEQLPATTATNTAPTPPVDVVLNFALEPNFRIYMGLGTAVAAGWVALPFAGKY